MKAIQSIFILFALLLLVQPTYSQAVKESRYGYAYADNAVIRTFISPIQKETARIMQEILGSCLRGNSLGSSPKISLASRIRGSIMSCSCPMSSPQSLVSI